MDNFLWLSIDENHYNALSDREKYQTLIDWALKARGRNPNVFDGLTEWVLDDAQWCEEKLAENRERLLRDVIARFQAQNVQIRRLLQELDGTGIVNVAAFEALDKFDDGLSGRIPDNCFQEAVAGMFADFSIMKEHSVRSRIAGEKTGAFGTDSVEIFGYLNCLKDLDAGVQWALFMPQMVENQQNGFQVQQFEYKKMPAMKFIGKESIGAGDEHTRREIFTVLSGLKQYDSELDYDVYLFHHYGRGVDVDAGHGFWGRFMKPGTPVPQGFVSFDFVPQKEADDPEAGLPYLSQFAYAVFSGDMDAIHRSDGFDVNAMYDITRNIMLGQGVNIPYPNKYWTAEVFLNGAENPSTAYMFSAEL